MISYSGFSLRDLGPRAIPGGLFAFYLWFEFSQHCEIKLETTALLGLVAYPIGMISEQIALWLKEQCTRVLSALAKKQLFKKYVAKRWFAWLLSRFSEEELIKKYLTMQEEESWQKKFWDIYLKIYVKDSPQVIALVERYNVTRFFFLNMAFLGGLTFSIHLIRVHSVEIWYVLLLILAVICFWLHLKSNEGFYWIIGRAREAILTKNDADCT